MPTSTINIIDELQGKAEEIWLHTYTPAMNKDGTYTYTAYQLAQESTGTYLDPEYEEELVSVKVDDFKCEFYESHIFRILAKFESLANLTAKQKTTFEVKIKDGKRSENYVGCPQLPKACKEHHTTPDPKPGFTDFSRETVCAIANRTLQGQETDKWLDNKLRQSKWYGARYHKTDFLKRADELISRIKANIQPSALPTMASTYIGGRFLFFFTFN